MNCSQQTPRISTSERSEGGVAATYRALQDATKDALHAAQQRALAVEIIGEATRKLWDAKISYSLATPGGQVVLTLDVEPLPLGSAVRHEGTPTFELPTKLEAHAAVDTPDTANLTLAEKPAVKRTAPLELKSGPWSKVEGENAMRWLDDGQSTIEIAKRLRRTPQAVGPKLAHMVRKRHERTAAAPATPKATPEPVAPPPSPTPAPVEPQPDTPQATSFTVDVARATNAACREIRKRLRRIGYPAPWTPAKDLALVQGLAAGNGLGHASTELGIGKAECKLRWTELLPVVTLDGQAKLLATLKLVETEAEG